MAAPSAAAAQGQPWAVRCRWCNRTKTGLAKALVCAVCDAFASWPPRPAPKP